MLVLTIFCSGRPGRGTASQWGDLGGCVRKGTVTDAFIWFDGYQAYRYENTGPDVPQPHLRGDHLSAPLRWPCAAWLGRALEPGRLSRSTTGSVRRGGCVSAERPGASGASNLDSGK